MSVWQDWTARLGGKAKPTAADGRGEREVLDVLGHLSIEEWLLLTYCVQRKQQTIALDVVHPAAGALVAKGLLVRAGSISHGAAWPYTVPAAVWQYFRTNAEVLYQLRGIPPDDPELEANLARLDKYLLKFDVVER